MRRLFSVVLNLRFSLRDQSSGGFSLLEIAIVLAIIGMLAGFAFPLFTRHTEQARHQKTHDRQREIIEALDIYFIHHNALPPPATRAGKGKSNAKQNQGIIPYRELGLPSAVAKDGFGYYMTYAVADSLSNEGAARKATDLGKINPASRHLIDETSKEVLLDNNNSMACILVSHGPKGTGAYAEEGETSRLNLALASEDERKNSNDTLTFITKPYSTNPAHLFRHRLVWRTHNKLKKLYRDFNLNEKESHAQKVADTRSKESQTVMLSFPQCDTAADNKKQPSTALASSAFSISARIQQRKNKKMNYGNDPMTKKQ